MAARDEEPAGANGPDEVPEPVTPSRARLAAGAAKKTSARTVTKKTAETSAAMLKRLRRTLARQIERIETYFEEDVLIDDKGARTLSTLTKTLENVIDLESAERRAREEETRKSDGTSADDADDDRFRDALAKRIGAMLADRTSACDPLVAGSEHAGAAGE
ncbi:hypothetical protein HDIA_1334 [Hartmannibacter diazotrophicus]|uniref:Uncharacterized protein n=1 Tax=Hartmannibacter diazotrophicus TaxID=1482074 RepID=A0A2C9D5T3_9HYPH|nr:hypothetical protein [Hartmannibacter diazotrophicus]SON54875.1 hypothetical protein HDIA_1334 [Hartmannibacter diazotrophicus]